MKYRILQSIPKSGSAPEYFYGLHQGQVIWIEFEDDDLEKWFGVFELGKLLYPKYRVDESENYLCILTQGNFYKIRKSTRICELKFSDSYILDFIELPTFSKFIFVEQTGLAIYSGYEREKWIETNFLIDAEIKALEGDEITLNVNFGEGYAKIKLSIADP